VRGGGLPVSPSASVCVAPPPVVAASASLGAPVPSTSPHRRPVVHKQRGRGVPPASAGGQEHCALREGLQDAETARSTMQGVLRCAEGHAVARVLPSGTLVVLVVYVLVDTGVVYCDIFVLGICKHSTDVGRRRPRHAAVHRSRDMHLQGKVNGSWAPPPHPCQHMLTGAGRRESVYQFTKD